MRRQPGGNYKKITGTRKTYSKTKKRRAIANKTKGKLPKVKVPGLAGATAAADTITGVAGADIFLLCILSSNMLSCIVPKLYIWSFWGLVSSSQIFVRISVLEVKTKKRHFVIN
jgi:hypothetical protein